MTNFAEEFNALHDKAQREGAKVAEGYLFSVFKVGSPVDNGTLTSREAAVKAIPLAAHQRQLVLTVLQAHGPLTREEIEKASGLSGNSVRPRVAELLKANVIEEVPDEWRETRSGRRASILRVVG